MTPLSTSVTKKWGTFTDETSARRWAVGLAVAAYDIQHEDDSCDHHSRGWRFKKAKRALLEFATGARDSLDGVGEAACSYEAMLIAGLANDPHPVALLCQILGEKWEGVRQSPTFSVPNTMGGLRRGGHLLELCQVHEAMDYNDAMARLVERF